MEMPKDSRNLIDGTLHDRYCCGSYREHYRRGPIFS